MKTRLLIILALVGLSFLIPTALANTPPISPDDLKKCLDGEFLQYDWCKRRISLQSPLKQYEMGVRYHDIQCKDGLELVGKLTTGTPACVKSQSVKELVYRGWATSDRIYPLTNPQTYVLTTNEETFPIKYSIDGSTMSEIIYDKDSNSLVIQLEDTIGGNLIISIPRYVIDATFGNNEDDEFFVLIDGVEVAFGEISDEQERTLTMLLPRESSIIEIIGTYLI